MPSFLNSNSQLSKVVKVIQTPSELRAWRKSLPEGETIGFVPTMGALHQGHATLLEKSTASCSKTVLSIFINPTQFNDSSDFDKYPQTFSADLALAERNLVDVVFAPDFSQMYPDDYRYKASESEFSQKLCGRQRPGHFDGVLSVVLKLLNIVQPHFAFFGEKDFQQYILVRDMVKAFFLDCQIIPVPTLREVDGLAMSSRNVRLTSEQRAWAPLIAKALRDSPTAQAARAQLESSKPDFLMVVEYIEDIDGRRLAAVKVGDVRLIDNVTI